MKPFITPNEARKFDEALQEFIGLAKARYSNALTRFPSHMYDASLLARASLKITGERYRPNDKDDLLTKLQQMF